MYQSISDISKDIKKQNNFLTGANRTLITSHQEIENKMNRIFL